MAQNEVRVLITAIDDALKTLEATRREVDSLARAGDSANRGGLDALDRKLRGAADASKLLATGLGVVGAGLIAGAGGALKLAADYEQAEIAFTSMLGSAEEAEEFLQELADFAAKTPFELKGLQTASRQLLAFGFQAADIPDLMSAIGDAVAALGGGSFEIERVTRALGQMQAKGKVSAEEMMQLAELGIPAWELLANAIGVSIPEAMKMAEKGLITGAQGIDAIVSGLGQRFGGMMAQQSRSGAA